MRRLALVLVAALATAGAASADVFRVVPTDGDRVLASAWAPNTPDALSLPYGFLAPPASPQRLSLPELQLLWQRAGAAYGIPWQVLAAINKVESNFGQNMGPSSAGAIGWMQFMPDTWLRWGTDADADGVADPWNAEDAVFSAARYLAAAGGRTDLRRAIFAYNHADWYVNEVLQIAQVYGGGVQVAADLEAVQRQVADAGASVEQAQAALDAALAEERRLAGAEAELTASARTAQLVSDQLVFQKAAADAGAQRAAAQRSVAERQAELERAQAGLATAREQAQTASFAPGARTLVAGASFDSTGWVFPVGGGPGIVSVGYGHHDYPAADIAAPEGSPVYALNDAVVTGTWQDDARCGIGLDLQTSDGRVWTYCHLSYLDPTLGPGRVVSAGTQVGLVGSTGNSTGPHLHLQLQPATAFPQQEAWFQAFAGTAFTWQTDAPAGAPAPAPSTAREPGRVFGVVPAEPAPADGGVVYFTR